MQSCTTGSYCPSSSSEDGDCGLGYYCSIDTKNRYGCPSGSYCDGLRLFDVTGPCFEGYYCPEGSITGTSEICPIGNFCPEGVGSPQGCEDGYYQTETGKSICNICPTGSYCNSTTTPPIICPGGRFCNGTGLTEFTGICKQGYYCPEGSYYQKECEHGSYCPEGSVDEVQCNCNSNGVCTSFTNQQCKCYQGYSGVNCEDFTCFGIENTNSSVCSGNGYCQNLDFCSCNDGYFGNQCEKWNCFGVIENSSLVCSGIGECSKPNQCICPDGFIDDVCSISLVSSILLPIGGVFAGIFVVLFLVCLIVSIPICIYVINQKRKLKEFDKYEDEINILKLEDQASNSNTPNFTISKEYLTIKQEDIQLLKLIGGGAFAEVFLCEWEGIQTALKLFRCDSIGTDEKDFKDFETELSFLASISHPNIIQFHGCSLKYPKFDIMLEYCGEGDLHSRIARSKSGWGKTSNITFKDICQWSTEIASAISYIHKRNIIHRDLKLDNILLSNNSIKICDFGISKILDQKNKSLTLTAQVGTSFYIAPEVALGKKYSYPCGVYSLGIIMYQLLTSDLEPYSFLGDKQYRGRLEILIAKNDLRPKIEQYQGKFKNKRWFIDLIKRCWNSDQLKRPTMNEIQEIIKKNFDVPKIPTKKGRKTASKNNIGEIRKLKKLVTEKNKVIEEKDEEINKLKKEIQLLKKEKRMSSKKPPPIPKKRFLNREPK